MRPVFKAASTWVLESSATSAARDVLFRRGPTVSGAIVVEPARAFFRAVEPEAERNNASRAARRPWVPVGY